MIWIQPWAVYIYRVYLRYPYIRQLKIKTDKNFAVQLQLRWRCCAGIEFSARPLSSFCRKSLYIYFSSFTSPLQLFTIFVSFPPFWFFFLLRTFALIALQSWHKNQPKTSATEGDRGLRAGSGWGLLTSWQRECQHPTLFCPKVNYLKRFFRHSGFNWAGYISPH